MLNSLSFSLLCYTRESVIAEKFETMVKFGELNSRMKDFYDIWLLSRQFDFEKETLMRAIHLTFKQRNTSFPQKIVAFSDEFVKAKQIQWAAFSKSLREYNIPDHFGDIISELRTFLESLFSTISFDTDVKLEGQKWQPPGPWK